MLDKKRARQTVLINDEDAKQAGIGTISTPRRQSRGVGEGVAETQNQLVIRGQRQPERMGSERSNSAAPDDQNTESNGDFELASRGWSKKMNAEEPPSDGYEQSLPREAFLKQTMDSKQFKGRPVSSQRAVVTGQNTADQKPAKKRSLVSKKQASANNMQYHDTSIERLLQEVTSDKFWHNPDESELQSVPGSFESAEEYIRVFEPLLFEECRAQLYSSYEESLEAVTKDAHVMVRVKTVERRERGWYDVVILPAHECKWTFKEGEVAILSFPRPGPAAHSSNSNRKTESECGRLVGRVRRHMPYDTRDPIGAIVRFYVGNQSDSRGRARSQCHEERRSGDARGRAGGAEAGRGGTSGWRQIPGEGASRGRARPIAGRRRTALW